MVFLNDPAAPGIVAPIPRSPIDYAADINNSVRAAGLSTESLLQTCIQLVREVKNDQRIGFSNTAELLNGQTSKVSDESLQMASLKTELDGLKQANKQLCDELTGLRSEPELQTLKQAYTKLRDENVALRLENEALIDQIYGAYDRNSTPVATAMPQYRRPNADTFIK
jgi:regulator of replication initiation timing